MGKKSYLINEDKNDTLKNEYENGLCVDILTTNAIPSDLREFCKSSIAYNDDEGEPIKDYIDICGCFYPTEYYNKLKEELIKRFPDVPSAYFNDKTCFSTLCSNSKLKHHESVLQCPATNFLTCINNAEFKASNVDNSGKIIFNQSNNCKISLEELNKPYCGKTCTNNDDCPDTCLCNDGICKNENSVSCDDYNCPDSKVLRDGALCSGELSTCNDNYCCLNIVSDDSSPKNSFMLFIENNLGYIIGGAIVVFILIIIGGAFSYSSSSD